ncbi:MAG: glycine-rich domain-containing protein [Verrucomicrobiota bacterium]
MKSSSVLTRLRRGLPGPALSLAALLVQPCAQAATIYWDGPSAGWDTAANWSTAVGATTPNPGAIPGVADVANFSISTVNAATTVSLNANQSVLGLSFLGTNTATTTLLGGGTARTLTLGSSGITVASGAGAVTLGNSSAGNNVLINLAGGQTWANNSANGFTINNTAATFTRNAGATLTFNKASTGNFAISTSVLPLTNNIVGPWAVFGLTTATTYATISGGNVAGLGYTGAADGTAAATAAAVTDTTGAVNYSVADVGTLGTGASFNTLNYTGAAGTIAGNFTANGLLNSSANLLTLSGAVTIGSTKEWVVNANGNITIGTAAIGDNGAGASALTKTGAGALTLSGANTYSGGTILNGGTLNITNSNALGSGTLTFTGGNLDNTSGNPVTLANIPQVWGKSFTFVGSNNLNLGTGSVSLETGSVVVGAVTITVNATAGTLTVGGAINANNNRLQLGVGGSGTIDLTGSVTNIGSTGYFGNVTVSGTVTAVPNVMYVAYQSGSVTTIPTGGLINLSSNSTNFVVCNVAGTSTLNVNGGTITNVGSTTNVGLGWAAGTTSVVTINSGLVNLTGATLDISHNATGYGTLNLNGGKLVLSKQINCNTRTNGSVNFGGGTLQLGANIATDLFSKTTFPVTSGTGGATIDVNGFSTTLGESISGAGGLTVISTAGGGTLTLSGTNTYTGATTVSAGTLALSATGSLNVASNVSLAAGATLDVSGLGASATYTLGSSASLTAAGTGSVVGTSAATIKGGASGTVSLGSRPITLSYDGSHPALYVSQGTLSLSGNAFTVNGAPLANGSYTIASQASGNITSSGTYPAATGTAIGSGKTATITVSGGNVNLTVSTNFVFDHFAISGMGSSQTAGTAITGITITAQDASNATATGFTGTVTFGGTAGITGTSASFTAGVLSGLNVTPTVAGDNLTFTVNDGMSHTGSATITTTSPGAANKLAFTTQPGGGAAGSAWATQPVVTVQDANGNTVTGSSASITLVKKSATGTGTLSGTATVAASNGMATFSGLSLDKTGAGYQLSATGDGLTGADSTTFSITSGAATHLTISGFPSSQAVSQAGSVTVTAKDVYDNTATGYAGTVTLTSSDAAATLPASHALTSGVYVFSVTLNTVGTQSITAGDGVLSATQSGISVTVAPVATSFTTNGTWTPPAGVTSIQLLVVAGGGGGGNNGACGGGGAGGLKYYGAEAGAIASSYTVTPGATYTVTVGAGGAVHASGQNSSFGAVTAVGGGYGGQRWYEAGGVGGSGGGASINAWGTIASGANGTSGQGNAGGGSYVSTGQQYAVGGGGGGAGTAGSNARLVGVVGAAGTFGYAGNGGDGLSYSISGTAVTYAGGGAGSQIEAGYNGNGGAGYLNPGGGGSAGTPGAGGVGALSYTAVPGQTGIVIVRYVPTTLHHFAISSMGSSQTAGTAITGITITAQDINNATETAFTGTVTFGGTAGISGTSGTFTAGVLTGVSVTPTLAGSNLTFTVSSGSQTASATIGTINPGALDHFEVSAIASPQTVGTAIDITTLTAKDANNNTVTGFTGTLDLTETGGGAGGTVTPAQSSAFTAGVLADQSVALSKAGSNVTITVTDHAGTGKTGASGSFTVSLGASSVAVTGSTSFTYTGSAQGPATASVTGSTGAVTYSYVGSGYGPSATKPTSAGSYTVSATVAADTNHNGASSTAIAFSIDKASQSIAFSLSASMAKSVGSVSLAATASSGLSVSFSSSTPPIASVSGTTLTLNQGGSVTITASQAGDANHNAATSVDRTLVITGVAAVNDAVSRPANSSDIKIPIATLLANDGVVGDAGTVTPGTGLTITGVSAGTGNSVRVSGAFVFYTPSDPAASAAKTFTYTVSDGNSTATATVTVSTVDATPFSLALLRVISAPVFANNQTSVTIEFAGVPGQTYQIECSTNLGDWSAPQAVATGSTGTFEATFTKDGNQLPAWNSLFFRATR